MGKFILLGKEVRICAVIRMLSIWLVMCTLAGNTWQSVEAKESTSYVTIVSLVRGRHRWIDDRDWLQKQQDLFEKHQVASTWLFDYDAINDREISGRFNEVKTLMEKGLFLEVTNDLAKKLYLPFDQTTPAHKANKAFLSGYDVEQRRKIIDELVQSFEDNFGQKPTAAGAWFIDSWSLGYLRTKYEIDAVVMVAEQYDTDQHTVRGHPWQAPYYPAKENSLVPGWGQSRLDSVVVQWAVRDPITGYGLGLESSNFSVQANDYTQKGLGIDHFQKLMEVYLETSWPESARQLTVGIEVGQEGAVYFDEFNKLIESVMRMRAEKVSVSEYAGVFRSYYRENPPVRFSFSDAGGTDWAGWVTTPKYRLGMVVNDGKLMVRDIRNYQVTNDDGWMMADKRSSLFRQTPAVVDQVGRMDQWTLLNNVEVMPQVDFLPNQVVVKVNGENITLGEEDFYTSFKPVKTAPIELEAEIQADKWTYRVKPMYLPYDLIPHWGLMILGYGLMMWYLVKKWIKGLLRWWVWVVAMAGTWVGIREWWVLTPFNDLGWSYWLLMSKGDVGVELIMMGAVMVPIVLGVVMITIGLERYKSTLLGLMAQWVMMFGVNLGWLLRWYRGIPVDVNKILGVNPHVMSFLPFFKLGIERLEYVFSAGAMHIEKLSILVKDPVGIAVGAIVLGVIQLGVAVIGWCYFTAKLVKSRQWLKAGVVVTMLIFSGLSYNSVDVKLVTIVDMLVRFIGIVGLMEVLSWLRNRNRFFKWAATAGVGVIIGLSFPSLISTLERQKSLQLRQEEAWSDKRAMTTRLKQSIQVVDVFSLKLRPRREGVVMIPLGIEDYYFFDSRELKTRGRVVDENSYGILINLNE